ncbi:MAG TPA: HGxxPAAW family protein [Streptosporangiaceae bacterium]|nr:HGxxPAAW family protein [Streptosporangiaceae bacterium]
MADQASSDGVAVAGEGHLAGPTAADSAALAAATGAAPEHQGHHGRPVSWVAVTIIVVGFLIGGAGLMFGPTWWLFWVGTGFVALGGILALGTGIFNDWY